MMRDEVEVVDEVLEVELEMVFKRKLI